MHHRVRVQVIKDRYLYEMDKDKISEEKVDMRHTCTVSFMFICIFFLVGMSMCLNTYIQVVYALKMRQPFLRHTYNGV